MNGLSQVESIFFAVLEKHSAEQRARCLDDLCRGDSALRSRVERLLNAYPRVGSFLEQPLVDAPALAEADLLSLAAATALGVSEAPGTLIGPYKLLEQIGEGGFGIVFMAEQLQPVRRKVALKILKPGMDSRAVIARFEAERQALALMDHENIARVLDAGTTDTGRPYFVMELVRGVPITQHCDEHELTAHERLVLFVAVCRAVQHAHTKGIIHRDLKPSNLLVTLHDGVPVVKVIDFGVAKALGQQLTDKTLFTGFAQMLGTPLYMSPEQAEMSGLDVDTRSDIYSLGVLLYELLTGTTPFDQERLRAVGYDEMRRIIREEDPPKPSTRINSLDRATGSTVAAQRKSDVRRLCQLMRRELDWIVMKALEKDRRRRYETASALAGDVESYLLGGVVAACPPSIAYRLRKVGWRHRAGLAVASAGLVVLGLLAGGAGWVAHDRQAREAAIDVEVARATTEAAALMDAAEWQKAEAAIDRGKKVLAAAGRKKPPPRLAELERDVRMALALDEIYGRPTAGNFWAPYVEGGASEVYRPPKAGDLASGDDPAASYAAAFREYGIDVAHLSVEEAASRIRASGIRMELARALDSWSSIVRRRGSESIDWKMLVDIAKAADPDPWRNLFREGRQQDSMVHLEPLALEADVEKLPSATLQLVGWSLIEIRAYPQAARLLRRAQMRYPRNVGINEILGYLHLRILRRNGEAARFYAAAHAAQPNNVNLIFNLGYALLRNGDVDDAASAFGEVIRLKPEFAEAYAWRAEAELGWPALPGAFKPTPDADQALADAKKAIELDATFAPAWAARGRARCRLNQWDEALGDLSRAVELDLNCAYAWNALAWMLATVPNDGMRDAGRALQASLRATELDGHDKDFISTLALAHFRAGDAAKAIEVVDEAFDRDDARNGVDWIVLAMSHAQLGHHDPATYSHYRAVKWAQRFRPGDNDLRRLIDESAALLKSLPTRDSAPAVIDPVDTDKKSP